MRTGRCYCGEVQYELDGTLGSMANCHCRYCRRAHGAAFATAALVRSADLRITSGEADLREYRTREGARFFCQRCAGRLFNRPASNAALTMLVVASLDEEPEQKPGVHINVASKAPWYDILDDLPQFPELPPQATEILEG